MVPDASTGAERAAFVLHEHHRPRHHFDLRLEEDGVLRSWAVPRGLPPTSKEDRLAIAVPDHDLDHLTFEDEHKSIADIGWWEDVGRNERRRLLVLHGRESSVRYALIDTGRDWLLHRTEDQPDTRGLADPHFALARLAEVYDPLDPDRSDLDVYAAMVDEYDARSVLDVGCGTGTFACLLAGRGIDVVGVDPAAASLDVARRKEGADRVTWIDGDATTLPADLRVDLAVMTANVAQVFLTDEAWSETLSAIHAALKPGGRLVFETRVPARRDWENWTPEHSRKTTDIEGVGRVESWHELLADTPPYVTFLSSIRFESDGALFTSESTLRFRQQDEIEGSLASAGFEVEEVRDAPERPGKEWVCVARAGPADTLRA